MISSGFGTSINDYNLKYANSVSAPLDPNLIAYYSFENEDETRATFTSVSSNVTFAKSNLPDPVCRCTESPDDESSNYPLLSPSTSSLDEIKQVRYPTSAISYKIMATITTNIRRFQTGNMKNATQLEIVTHRGLWSFGIYNKTAFYANITGVPNIVIFQVSPQRMRSQTLFLNYWMNYTLMITKDQALLIISDLTTQTPLTISVTFETPIKVDELFSQAEASGIFALKPQGIDCVVSRLIYSISDSQVFDFTLSLDNFVLSTKGAEVTNKNYQSRTYIGYFQSSDKQLLSNYPGIQFDQVSGPCNISNPSFAFDGVVCKDKKKFLFLNKERKSNQRLEGYLRSTSNMFTFETWFKFMGFANEQQESAVMLQVYGLMDALQLQISILPGQMPQLFTIECDPNSKVPRVPNFQDPVTISDLIQIGTWMHYSCVSNFTSQELKAYLSDSSSTITYSSQQRNSYVISVPEGISARTIIGNNLAATNPYVGFLREMRFWKVARGQDEIEDYLFSSIPLTSELRNQMLVYAMLNEGHGIQTIELEQVSYMNTQNLYLASVSNSIDSYPQTASSLISWQQDLSAIKVCPPDTIYHFQTNCCTKATYYITTQKSSFFSNDDGKFYLSLSVQISSNFTVPNQRYFHSWSIVNISNYNNSSKTYDQHMNEIQSYLQNTHSTLYRDVHIPQDIMMSNAIYMFKASVKSLVMNYDAIREQYVAVKPDCPLISLTPKSKYHGSLLVSQKMDPNLLILKAEIIDKCVEPLITSSEIQWTISNSLISYVLSEDRRTLTFKELKGANDLKATVIYKFSRNNNQKEIETVTDSLDINFVDEPFKLNLNENSKPINAISKLSFLPSPEFIVSYPILDSEKKIEYLLECPSNLFISEKERISTCKPNQVDGTLFLSITKTSFVNYQDYKFTYIMKSSILGYEQRKDIIVSFYQPTSYSCPKISLPSYTSYKITDDNFIIRPNIQLDCIRNASTPDEILESYALKSVQWLVEGYSSPIEFLDIDNNTAVVRRTSPNAALFKPYFRQNITFEGTLNNGTVLQAKTTFQILKADIFVNITSSQLSSNVVAFNNTLTLDASNSYDPDEPSQTLNVNWALKGGSKKFTNNQAITLSPFDRMDMQFNIGQYESIQIDLMNNNYPEKVAKKTLSYKFEEQNDNRVAVFGSNCEIALSNTNTTYLFSKDNITSIQVTASVDSTKCFGQKYLNTQGKFYTDLPDIFRKSDQPNYISSDTITLQKEQISLIEPGKTVIVHFIYLVSYQLQFQNDVFYDYLVKTIAITRLMSPMVIQLSGVPNLDTPINVGQESSIILDASPSYDPDYPTSQSSFTYEWKCSYGLSCDSSGPLLTISKSMREQRGVNDIGTIIEIGVKVYSLKKQSQLQTLKVKIDPQNFDKCLELAVENSDESNILAIYKDQEYPLQVRLSPKYLCANMTITNVSWSTQDVPQFWTTASNSQIYFTIPSPSLIQEGISKITVTAIAKYTVFATSLTTTLQKSFTFKLKIEGSQIVPVVQTNNPYSSLIDIGTNFIFQLSAQKSFDPDNTSKQVVCAWTCPTQIINAARCPYQGCDLSFNVSTDIKMLNETAASEVLEFIVVVQTLDEEKTAQRSVYFTLLSPSQTEQLPLCSIKNANGKSSAMFEVDSEMVFYPKCLPRTLNSSYDGEYKFEWLLSPKVNGVMLDQYRLSFAPFQLLQVLTNKTAGSLEISLRVFTDSTEYVVKKVFKIPTLYDRHPNATFAKFEVSPAIIQTQFTNMRALVSHYDLIGNAYFRLRVQLRDGTQQIVVSRFTGVLADAYLPKGAEQIFLDIIENKRANQGDYNIFTFKPEVTPYIEDVTSMSKQIFAYKVSPRLEKQEDPNFDYNDASLVQQTLDNLKILKKIISIANKEGQSRYNSLMYPQVELLLNKTISLNRVTNFESTSSTFKRFISGFFEIMGPMYIESCSGEFSEDAIEYLKRINDEILSDSSLVLIQDRSTESQIKKAYVKNLNAFAKATCLNETQRSLYRRMSDQIFISIIIEGEFYPFSSPLDSLEVYTLYKISDFDIASRNLIKYAAPDNQFTVRVISDILPMETRYITFRMIDSVKQDNNQTIQEGSEYIVSYSLSQVNMFDHEFSKIPINSSNYHNFEVQIEFNLQKSMLQSILSKKDRLTSYLYCISKQEEDINFSNERKLKTLGIFTDYSQVNSGRITCISSHLTQFAVMFSPFSIVVDPPSGYPIDTSDSIPLLQQTPLLLYLMPALLAVVILLLAVIGLIMNQLEYNRPPRFYNKLTLTENIQKYSLLRMTGCMILQFNPLFNYIFKTNLYLGRPLRLLLFINYLNLFSVASLIYYSSLGEGLRIADIFWFGIIIEVLIIVLRPRVQEIIFGLFYPPQLASWKSKEMYRMRKQKKQLPPEKTKTKKAGLYTEEEDNEIGDPQEKPTKRPIDYEPSKKRPQSSKMIKEVAGLDQTERFDNSGKRLIFNHEMKNKNIDDTTDIILQQNQQFESPDTQKGDEVQILRDKKKKKKDKTTAGKRKGKQTLKNEKNANEQKNKPTAKGSKKSINQNWLEQQQNAAQEDQTDITQQKLQKSDTSSSENSQPNDFDNKAIDIDLMKFQKIVNSRAQYLPDINQQQHSPVRIIDRNSNELLRDSIEFNPHQSEIKGNKDYAGFEFEQVEVQGNDNTRNHPIHIDLQSRELSALDIDDSRDDLQKQFYAAPEEEDVAYEYGEEYYFEDAELQNDENQQKEGGEIELQSIGKCNDEEFKENTNASPTPLQGFSRIDQQDNSVKTSQPYKRSAKRNNEQENDIFSFDYHNQKKNQGPPQTKDGQQIQQSYPEESTPSLESVYKNYRELKLQLTNPLKKIIGILLLLLQFVASIVVHGVLLIDLTKNQFLNWISCTIFSFTVMIFLTDSVIYSVVAWALKRTNGITDRRKLCSLFNIFIYWPLGKWKFMELEIELAKLKDFDKEYEVSRQA